VGNGSFIPCLGDVEVAVTASVLPDVGFSVGTGADNVTVPFSVPRCQSTRAGHIAVTFLVYKYSFKQFKGSLTVLVEMISLWFLDLLEDFIEI